MRLNFRIELDVVLDAEKAGFVIDAAKRCCQRDEIAAIVDDSGVVRIPQLGELIDGVESALIVLTERNPVLADAQVEVEGVTCFASVPSDAPPSRMQVTHPEVAPPASQEDVGENNDAEVQLDEFETGLYLCRWPNGDFSLVKAEDRKDAVVQLDEWAGAEPAWLVPVETCMVDFRLNDRGEVELVQFGEEADRFIWENCYPALDQVHSELDAIDHRHIKGKRQIANRIRRAVEHERKRLWHLQGEGIPARTTLGRELQKRLRTVGPVADDYAEVAAGEILRGKVGENGNPN